MGISSQIFQMDTEMNLSNEKKRSEFYFIVIFTIFHVLFL